MKLYEFRYTDFEGFEGKVEVTAKDIYSAITVFVENHLDLSEIIRITLKP